MALKHKNRSEGATEPRCSSSANGCMYSAAGRGEASPPACFVSSAGEDRRSQIDHVLVLVGARCTLTAMIRPFSDITSAKHVHTRLLHVAIPSFSSVDSYRRSGVCFGRHTSVLPPLGIFAQSSCRRKGGVSRRHTGESRTPSTPCLLLFRWCVVCKSLAEPRHI